MLTPTNFKDELVEDGVEGAVDEGFVVVVGLGLEAPGRH